MILWFRLHWIVIQWIANTATFVRDGLACYYVLLATSPFSNTQILRYVVHFSFEENTCL